MKNGIVALLLSGIFAFSTAFAADAPAPAGSMPTPASASAASAGSQDAGTGKDQKQQDSANQPGDSCGPEQKKPGIVPGPNAVGATDGKPYMLELGQWIPVRIPKKEYDESFVKKDGNLSPTPVMYINNVAIKGLASQLGGCNEVQFLLQRTEDSRDVWGRVLPKLDGQIVTVGVGTVQKGFITQVDNAELILSHGKNQYLWIIGMLALVVLTWLLASMTNLLRDFPHVVAVTSDHSSDTEQCTQTIFSRFRDKKRRPTSPYSLGRAQMAWWFVLAVGAFSYIWLMTGDIGDMPSSILALMGISASTTVLSAVIDTGNSTVQTPSVCFLTDILTDNNGVSFHRLQMFVWTILLGIIFINKVSQTLSMPDFDTQLLGLMGVASGTYLGFKIPASATPTQPASPPPAAGNPQNQ